MTSIKRQLTGVVIRAKNPSTLIVNVDTVKVHPKYHKRYKLSKSYPAHNENPEIKAGDKVVIQESRPLSKTKNWKVVSKL